MPDVTMCQNEDCQEKRSCYRYMATPKELWQSYAMFGPVGEKGCAYRVSMPGASNSTDKESGINFGKRRRITLRRGDKVEK